MRKAAFAAPIVQWAPPEDEEWVPYMYSLPRKDEILEFHSIWKATSFFARADDFAPEMNVSGLYWRFP